MLTSIHVANIGPKAAVFRPPKPGSVPGLVRADGGLAPPLTTKTLPAFNLNRVAMVARWQSVSSLDSWLGSTGSEFADGWHARCEQIRATGKWDGVPADLPMLRTPAGDGPVITVTQSLIRWKRAAALLKFNAMASATVLESSGLKWGCTLVGVPWFGTITMWENAQALFDAVYEKHGNEETGHRLAMEENRKSSFFRESVYVRMAPVSIHGSVPGKNPIDEHVFTS